MKENKLEDLFKDSFENFEPEVSPSVWKNVQTAIKGAGIGLLGKAILNKIGANTLVAVVSSAAAVVGTVVVMNWGSKPEQKQPAATTKTIAEVPKPAKVEEIKEFLSDNTATGIANKKMADQLQVPDNQSEEPAASVGVKIKKDKMDEVISEYSEMPVASISASPVGGAVPLVVNLANNGIGKVNKWNFGDGQKESGVNPVHVYDVPGIYTIALTSLGADGKVSIDSLKVEVTGNSSIPLFPREFSPNGDKIQDTFSFKPVNMVSMNVVVFDKKGKVLYKSDNLDAKWDGNDMKGKKVKDGLYFFIQTADGLDGKKYEQRGSIKLTK
ncbi:MAG: domain containing protein [Bacteroidetes bacterium]|nr:domain containing protein [Bacteroidota bacterium]